MAEPRAVRNLLYRLVGFGDPTLADELHNQTPGRGGSEPSAQEASTSDGVKPMTGCVIVTPDERCWLRATALTEAVGQAMLHAAHRIEEGDCLPLGRELVRLGSVVRQAPRLALRTSYPTLALSQFSPVVAMEFLAPTVVSQGGSSHLSLPSPAHLIRGWARKWNAFAPREMAIGEDTSSAVARNCRIGAGARIETVECDQPTAMIGFVGIVPFEAVSPKSWSAGERQAFAALTAFSQFCGSGARTMQGMGATVPAEGLSG